MFALNPQDLSFETAEVGLAAQPLEFMTQPLAMRGLAQLTYSF
jgi:hypothetical protein